MTKILINKVVLLTGASRGIGTAIGRCLLDSGYHVAVGYCHHPGGTRDMTERYPNAFAVHIDISDRISIKKSMTEIYERFGSAVNILVNNGAIAQEKPFQQLTDQDWERMLAVNLRGPFACIQEVLPQMLEQQWGRIVNVVSIGGQWGGANQVHYAAAKAGLINLTRSMAKLYSCKGITSNAVSPGLVQTDMTRTELSTKAGRAKVASIPVGRIGTSDEVAAAVKFLCSDEASYITGQTINVNGGMYFG